MAGVHLVVMKYEFHPLDPDVVSVYFDPTVGVEPVVADAQISIASSDLVITHQGAFTQFTFSGSGHLPGAIDEIRWGDTFIDVAAPEPNSSFLLCLAAASVLRARREYKKRKDGRR